MSGVVDTLRDRRLKVWEDAKSIAERAADEKRNMSGEEERQWDELNAELSALDTRIQSILTGEQRAKDAAEAMDRLAGKKPEPGIEARGGDGASIDYAEEIRKLARRQIDSIDLRLPSNIEQRTLLDSNVPLPTSFVGQLYRYLVDTSTIRQANPTVFSTSSGENLVVPRATAYGSASWTAEGGALQASDPTLSSVTLGAHKVGVLVQISRELLDDEGFDVVGFIASQAGMLIGIAVDTAYVGGTGTTQPLGFSSAATVALQGPTGSLGGLPTSGSVTGADVMVELYHSIIPQYRPRASWVMHDATVKVIRKLKDSTGQYLWQPALVAGQPDTILGRPVFPDPHMPELTAASAPAIAFGDFRGYFIRDVTPLRFERSDEYAFGTDLVSFRALYRTDGQLADTNAIKTYETPAS
nr:phage major capsid protein [Mycobacterium eburneum]